jgi:hypothetical protein
MEIGVTESVERSHAVLLYLPLNGKNISRIFRKDGIIHGQRFLGLVVELEVQTLQSLYS